jgi:hypothetical protein
VQVTLVATNVSSIVAGEYKKTLSYTHSTDRVGADSIAENWECTLHAKWHLIYAVPLYAPPPKKNCFINQQTVIHNSHHRSEKQHIFWQDHIILNKSQALGNRDAAHSKTKLQF